MLERIEEEEEEEEPEICVSDSNSNGEEISEREIERRASVEVAPAMREEEDAVFVKERREKSFDWIVCVREEGRENKG